MLGGGSIFFRDIQKQKMVLMLSEKFFDAAGGKHQKAGSGPKKMGVGAAIGGRGTFLNLIEKKSKMVLPSKIFFWT